MVIYFQIEHLGVFKLTMGDFWNPIAILPNGSIELRKIENEKRLGCKQFTVKCNPSGDKRVSIVDFGHKEVSEIPPLTPP